MAIQDRTEEEAMSDKLIQTEEDAYRFIAEGDTDTQIEYARRLAEGLEQLGAARELTVEATIMALACAGLELREGSDAQRADLRLTLEKDAEIKRLQQRPVTPGGTPQTT
jgi:hypothetical protein